MSRVGWAKARSAVLTIHAAVLMVGTLRFAHESTVIASQRVRATGSRERAPDDKLRAAR